MKILGLPTIIIHPSIIEYCIEKIFIGIKLCKIENKDDLNLLEVSIISLLFHTNQN